MDKNLAHDLLMLHEALKADGIFEGNDFGPEEAAGKAALALDIQRSVNKWLATVNGVSFENRAAEAAEATEATEGQGEASPLPAA